MLLWLVEPEYDGYGEADSASVDIFTTLMLTVVFSPADTAGTLRNTLIEAHVAPDFITIWAMPLTSAQAADPPVSVTFSRASEAKLRDEPSAYPTDTARVTEVATLTGDAAAGSPAGASLPSGELAEMLVGSGMTTLT